MIRINLLSQPRPKTKRPAVPLGPALQVLTPIILVVVGVGILLFHRQIMTAELEQTHAELNRWRGEKAHLEDLKRKVEEFERRKQVLQQRIAVIESLRRSKTGAQELLDMLATTVTRTDSLWLTSVERKGSALTIEGTAGSITAVANYITQLKRSGYFQNVEIKESQQDERSPAVQIFQFTLTAEFVLPGSSGTGGN